MRLARWLPATLLLLAAIASSWALWFLYREQQPEPLVGPPRSDYFLIDFELVALNEEGKESFRATGPLLSRHPQLGTITIERPLFQLPAGDTNTPWQVRADHAWASANAEELRLNGDVRLDGPADDARNGDLHFRSNSLIIYPKEQRLSSDDQVMFTSPRSILQGTGFRADMQTRRFQLLDKVTGHYDSPEQL